MNRIQSVAASHKVSDWRAVKFASQWQKVSLGQLSSVHAGICLFDQPCAGILNGVFEACFKFFAG